MTRLLSLALLLVACTNGVPAEQPTPRIIYLTPPPIVAQVEPTLPPGLQPPQGDLTPSPLPTQTLYVNVVTPAPTLPPVPRDAGTPWLTYLEWGGDAFTELQGIMEIGADGYFFTAAAVGTPVVSQQLAWLASHPPLSCYALLHSTHVLQLTQIKASFEAINEFDLEAGLEHLTDSKTTSELWTVLIDSVDCF